ncbi:MAG: hypothetical protein H6609_17820 [Ignavibacteriales bacterium]|nr:hypothetical protein [Ignavibacteriales bacterium]
MYVPKNVIITEKVKKYPEAQIILNRIMALNPKVKVTYSNNEKPQYPGVTNSADRYHYMKDTVVLAHRGDPFIETFASPGRIFEKPGTMVKSVFMCGLECKFCYLQTTAIRHYRQRIFLNTDHLENEILNELVLDPMIRSILSIMEKLSGQNFYKIPKNFKKVCDKIRKSMNGRNRKLLTEKKVRDYLKTRLYFILEEMEFDFDRSKLMRILDKLDLIYDKNKSYKPVFVISEYTDLLAIDHISDNFKLFMDLIQKYTDLEISFRTRSESVDRFIQYDGKDRVLVTIQLDPDYVIRNYQINTSTLTERIIAIGKVLNAKGFKLKIAMEPIIMYKGFEKDYVDLIQELAKHIDMKKVDNFDIGCLRASSNLQTEIRKNYPKTDVLNLEHPLEKPVDEKKWRYPLAERVKIYKVLINEIRKYSSSRISLGAENPEAWIQSGLQIPKSSNYYYKLK